MRKLGIFLSLVIPASLTSMAYSGVGSIIYTDGQAKKAVWGSNDNNGIPYREPNGVTREAIPGTDYPSIADVCIIDSNEPNDAVAAERAAAAYGWGDHSANTDVNNTVVVRTYTGEAIKEAVKAMKAKGGGTVLLECATYLFTSENDEIDMNDGNAVRIVGCPGYFSPCGIIDLQPVIAGGTIFSGPSGLTAIRGNNVNGGGLYDISITGGMDGVCFGKQNQFGCQFFTIDRVYVFNPANFGFKIYNFAHINSRQICAFHRQDASMPTRWDGIYLIAENDSGLTATINDTNDFLSFSELGYDNNDVVYFISGTMPSASPSLSTGVPYWVINADQTDNVYQLSRTRGGTAINFLDAGASVVIAGCAQQPGNSEFTGTYVLWNSNNESTARVLRGIHLQALNPVYDGVEHTGQVGGLLTFIRPQVNMFGFTGTLSGSNRINFCIDGNSLISDTHIIDGDFEGNNEYHFYAQNLQYSYIDIATVSSVDDAVYNAYLDVNAMYNVLTLPRFASTARDISTRNITKTREYGGLPIRTTNLTNISSSDMDTIFFGPLIMCNQYADACMALPSGLTPGARQRTFTKVTSYPGGHNSDQFRVSLWGKIHLSLQTGQSYYYNSGTPYISCPSATPNIFDGMIVRVVANSKSEPNIPVGFYYLQQTTTGKVYIYDQNGLGINANFGTGTDIGTVSYYIYESIQYTDSNGPHYVYDYNEIYRINDTATLTPDGWKGWIVTNRQIWNYP